MDPAGGGVPAGHTRIVCQPGDGLGLAPGLLFEFRLEAVERVFQAGDQPQGGEVVFNVDPLLVVRALQHELGGAVLSGAVAPRPAGQLEAADPADRSVAIGALPRSDPHLGEQRRVLPDRVDPRRCPRLFEAGGANPVTDVVLVRASASPAIFPPLAGAGRRSVALFVSSPLDGGYLFHPRRWRFWAQAIGQQFGGVVRLGAQREGSGAEGPRRWRWQRRWRGRWGSRLGWRENGRFQRGLALRFPRRLRDKHWPGFGRFFRWWRNDFDQVVCLGILPLVRIFPHQDVDRLAVVQGGPIERSLVAEAQEFGLAGVTP